MQSLAPALPRLRLAVLPIFFLCAFALVAFEHLAEPAGCRGVTATIGVRN